MKKFSKSLKRYHSKSKSNSKVPSGRSSKANIYFSSIKLNTAKLKSLVFIQRNWRNYYKINIENKIIKIQSIYKGFNIRKIFNEIMILNKKLESFCFIIKLTMFRHGIKFDYVANKRIDYYSDHKKAKQFLLLQRRIRYFLFMKKVQICDKLGLFDDVYIKTIEYRTKIKSKASEDKYFSKPIYKFHRPLTKIIKIQKNYRLHLKFLKKLPKYNINKTSLNKCPLISKLTKIIIKNDDEIYKKVKMRPINNRKDFYIKYNYNYSPLIILQRKYKERFNYLKENYQLKKHEKIKKVVINKQHYIYRATVIDVLDKILTIQKNIKYFLYRKHSIVNLIPKIKIQKCEIKKSYGFKEFIKQFFYEDFTKRIIEIIRKYFLSLYLNEIKKKINFLKKNISKSFNVRNMSTDLKRNSLQNETSLHFTNKVRQLKRKETFSLSPKKVKPISNIPRHSNLNNNDSKDKGTGKKKVSFKNDNKLTMKDSKFSLFPGNITDDVGPSIKNSKSLKKSELSTFLRKKPFLGTIKNSPVKKKK